MTPFIDSTAKATARIVVVALVGLAPPLWANETDPAQQDNSSTTARAASSARSPDTPQASVNPDQKHGGEKETSTDPVARNEMAVEAIDGQVAADSYPNEWEYGTGVAVPIATAEDVYQTVPVDALKGQRVVNLQAKSVGTVEDVVQADGANTAALVIKTGGFFGLGAKESVVPLKQFYFVGEQLVWETRLSKDDIKKSDRYQFDEELFSSLLQD